MAEIRNQNLFTLLQGNPVGQSYQQGFQNALAKASFGLEKDKFSLAQRAQAAQEAYQNRAMGLEEGKFGYVKDTDRFNIDKEETAAQDQAAIAKAMQDLPTGHKLIWDTIPTYMPDKFGRKYMIQSVGNLRYIKDEDYGKLSPNEKALVDAQDRVAKEVHANTVALKKGQEATSVVPVATTPIESPVKETETIPFSPMLVMKQYGKQWDEVGTPFGRRGSTTPYDNYLFGSKLFDVSEEKTKQSLPFGYTTNEAGEIVRDPLGLNRLSDYVKKDWNLFMQNPLVGFTTPMARSRAASIQQMIDRNTQNIRTREQDELQRIQKLYGGQ